MSGQGDGGRSFLGVALLVHPEFLVAARPFHQLTQTGAEFQWGRECLAFVRSITYFRPSIFGRPLTVYPDHASLKWLHNIATPSGRLVRWAMLLADSDLTVPATPRALGLNPGPSGAQRVRWDLTPRDPE